MPPSNEKRNVKRIMNKYFQILPPIPAIDVTGCGSTKGCYRLPEDCLEIECEYIFTWADKGNHMVFEMSALTDGFNDRYFAVGLSEDIYMVSDTFTLI